MHRSDDRLPVDRPVEQVGQIGPPALRAAELFEFVAAAQLALVYVGAARKARPLPLRIATSASGSRSKRRNASDSWRTTSSLTALSFSGRFSVIVAILGAGILNEVLFVRVHRSLQLGPSRPACGGRRRLSTTAPKTRSAPVGHRRTYPRSDRRPDQTTWKTYSRIMIGIGIPISQRRMPLPILFSWVGAPARYFLPMISRTASLA